MSDKWRSVDCGCSDNPGVWQNADGDIVTVEELVSAPYIERVTTRHRGRSTGRIVKLVEYRFARHRSITASTLDALRNKQPLPIREAEKIVREWATKHHGSTSAVQFERRDESTGYPIFRVQDLGWQQLRVRLDGQAVVHLGRCDNERWPRYIK